MKRTLFIILLAILSVIALTLVESILFGLLVEKGIIH